MIMFDIISKFESTIKVKAIDKNFEDMTCLCGTGSIVPYSLYTYTHDVKITNSPIIPNEEWIEKAREIISDELVKSFEKNNIINAVVLDTVFVGFTKISEK